MVNSEFKHDYNGSGYEAIDTYEVSESEALTNDKIDFCLSPDEVQYHIKYYTRGMNERTTRSL